MLSVKAPEEWSEEIPVAFEFQVADTGIGIPQDEFERIFVPFFQLDSGLSRRYQGAGLGLSLSQGLAKMMGGKLSIVSSEMGKGTVFALHIPFKCMGQDDKSMLIT